MPFDGKFASFGDRQLYSAKESRLINCGQMTLSMPAKQIARLSFETAQRALEIHGRAAKQLRSRTSTLLTASSLIASFFDEEAITRGSGLGPFGVRGLSRWRPPSGFAAMP